MLRTKWMKRLLLSAMMMGLVVSTTGSSKVYAMTEAEIIAALKEKGSLSRPDANGQGDASPGHEYGGSFDLLSQSSKDKNDNLVRQRAAERGITIRQYLEETGQTLPSTSSLHDELDKVPSTSSKPSSSKHEHSYKETVTKEATCVEKGEKTFTCDCGNSYKEEISVTEHNYEEEVTKEATCKETGVKTFTCIVCGDAYEEELPIVAHEKGAAKTTKEATCTENGERITYCKFCGEELETEVVEAYGHEAGEPVLERKVGFLSNGLEVVRCTECKEIMESTEIPYNPMNLYIVIGVAVLAVIGIGVVVIVKRKRYSFND